MNVCRGGELRTRFIERAARQTVLKINADGGPGIMFLKYGVLK
jgi:hypothetical protein